MIPKVRTAGVFMYQKNREMNSTKNFRGDDSFLCHCQGLVVTCKQIINRSNLMRDDKHVLRNISKEE